jgi:pimeloyl-ACP methyl ester carboxylesterase
VTSIYKTPAGKHALHTRYRAVLQRWPVPHRHVIVPTSQGDTFLVTSGDRGAPPVVLLHGSGSNSAIWMRDVVDLSKQYCVYSVDIIGEPGLSAESRPSLRSDAHAVWLDEVWNHLGITSASIMAISFGGWLALDYAVRRPARVRSLSLLSPAGIGTQNHWSLLRLALLRTCGTWGLRRSLRLVTGAANLPQPLVDAAISTFTHFRPRMEKLPVRTDEELARLEMPVQIIVGAKDVLLHSSQTRDRVERWVPDSRVVYLENAGHILPSQTTAVMDFLRESYFGGGVAFGTGGGSGASST